MERIKLTKEHQDKLYKMMKHFYPEYLIYSYPNILGGMIRLQEKNKVHTSEKPNEIHWYEFCMNDLSRAIFNHPNFPSGRSHGYLMGITEMIKTSVWYPDSFHIVDYLYRQYLLTTKEAVQKRVLASVNICS